MTTMNQQSQRAAAVAQYQESTQNGSRHEEHLSAEDQAVVLELLADEYACSILQALDDTPTSVDSLAEECNMSRPTLYRRLERLLEADMINARINPLRDGHHRREYWIKECSYEFDVADIALL
jgi:predicted transcriptional regulator